MFNMSVQLGKCSAIAGQLYYYKFGSVKLRLGTVLWYSVEPPCKILEPSSFTVDTSSTFLSFSLQNELQ